MNVVAIPRFAIFYADGSVTEGGGAHDELVPVTVLVSRDWLAAKSDRVLFVAVAELHSSRQVLQGGDFYFPVTSCEGFGVADHLGAWLRGNLPEVMKLGEYVSGKRFVAVLQEVKRWKCGG